MGVLAESIRSDSRQYGRLVGIGRRCVDRRLVYTNTQEGELQRQVLDVQPNKIRTKYLNDTTFFSSYLKPVGTEITLTEVSATQTQIALRIDYQPKLDPAWYFHSLQQYGVARMPDFLIDELMLREYQ